MNFRTSINWRCRFCLFLLRMPIVSTFQGLGRVPSRRVAKLSATRRSIHSKALALDTIKRVFCLSDLHTDHADNFDWLRSAVTESDLSKTDLVVVAGDVSHDYARFEDSLQILAERTEVVFIPGNHEAWLSKQDPASNSLDKLDLLSQKCQEMGIHTEALYISGDFPLWVLPLHSWYDGSLSFDEDLSKGLDKWPWVDFIRCKWTDRFPPFPNSSSVAKIPQGLVDFFLKKNLPILNQIAKEVSATDGVMTVSHFLPNQQCLPDWCELDASNFKVEKWLNHGAGAVSAKFAKVAGTELLDAQLRSIDLPDATRRIHVFGHSHRPKDFEFESVRYIHNPLGKPKEREIQMINPDVTFQLVWETDSG